MPPIRRSAPACPSSLKWVIRLSDPAQVWISDPARGFFWEETPTLVLVVKFFWEQITTFFQSRHLHQLSIRPFSIWPFSIAGVDALSIQSFSLLILSIWPHSIWVLSVWWISALSTIFLFKVRSSEVSLLEEMPISSKIRGILSSSFCLSKSDHQMYPSLKGFFDRMFRTIFPHLSLFAKIRSGAPQHKKLSVFPKVCFRFSCWFCCHIQVSIDAFS